MGCLEEREGIREKGGRGRGREGIREKGGRGRGRGGEGK